MALSGRFRTDTRSMRMERLHGPKGAHSGPRALSSRGTGEAASGGTGRARAVSARALGKGQIDRGPLTISDLTSAGPHDGAPSAPEPPS